jgi:hypothetical protein
MIISELKYVLTCLVDELMMKRQIFYEKYPNLKWYHLNNKFLYKNSQSNFFQLLTNIFLLAPDNPFVLQKLYQLLIKFSHISFEDSSIAFGNV